MLSSVALLKSTKEIFNEYLLIALTAPYFYREMRAGMTGVAITRETLKKLNKAFIALPLRGTVTLPESGSLLENVMFAEKSPSAVGVNCVGTSIFSPGRSGKEIRERFTWGLSLWILFTWRVDFPLFIMISFFSTLSPNTTEPYSIADGKTAISASWEGNRVGASEFTKSALSESIPVLLFLPARRAVSVPKAGFFPLLKLLLKDPLAAKQQEHKNRTPPVHLPH